MEAIFDAPVIDIDAPSHVHGSVAAIYQQKKKRRNTTMLLIAQRALFTPFVVSVDGALGHYLKHLSERICVKWFEAHA